MTSISTACHTPDYFTRSTGQALKALAVGFLLSGHFYSFCIGGEGLMAQSGEWAVMIFLVVSGMGLTKSYGFNRCEKGFILRRLSTVFVPLWPVLAAVYLIEAALLGRTYPWPEMVLAFLGIIRKAPPNAPLWFISFILYLYGAFFLISNIPVSKRTKCILLISASFCTTVLITWIPVLSDCFGGWTTYTFVFPLAATLMAGRTLLIKGLRSLSRRSNWILIMLWAAMAGCFVAMPAGRTLFFMVFIAVSIFYLDTIKTLPRFVAFIGGHSYEIYLLHFPFLVSYGQLFGWEPLALFLGLYCLSIFSLAVALKKGSNWIRRRIWAIGGRPLQEEQGSCLPRGLLQPREPAGSNANRGRILPLCRKSCISSTGSTCAGHPRTRF